MTAQEPRTTGAVWGAWCRRLVPVVVATLLLLGATMGVSRAAWGDTQALTGAAVSGYTVPAPVLECTASASTARIEWVPQSSPVPVGYVATVNGGVVTPTASAGKLGVTVTFPGVLGISNRTVSVYAVVTGTSWTSTVASRTARGTVVVGVPLVIACL